MLLLNGLNMQSDNELYQRIKQKLTTFGFTGLESEVYLHLLINGTSTGYAVAKGIGKAVANVYKATESLAAKGAVEHAMGDSKSCSAVPWQQLLEVQQQKFKHNLDSLTEDLKRLPESKPEEQVYQLTKFEQVLQHSLRIIDEAEHILLGDIEPEALPWLADSLVRAAERGVEVKVKLYQQASLPGVDVILRQQGEQIYAKTRDINFNLCSDGKEMIMALITADKKQVIQAFRTRSALMNMYIYIGLLYGQILTDLKQSIPAGELKAAQQTLEQTAHLHPFSSENAVFDVFKQRYHQE